MDTLLNPNQGAIKAAEEAKEQGLIRAIGVTGHNNPEIFVKAFEPLSLRYCPSFLSTQQNKHTPRLLLLTRVLPLAQQQNTGIIAMKVPAYGRLFQPGALTGMAEAMGYVLSQPQVHCCIIAADTFRSAGRKSRCCQELSTNVGRSAKGYLGGKRTASVWQEASFFRQWS